MIESPQIFTFYSFKGGVGRSMALINVAYSLASKGRNVLILDMDLEAPGLSGFLRREHEIGELARFDMVDLIRFAAEMSDSMNDEARELTLVSLPSLSDIVVPFQPERRIPVKEEYIEPGRLDVIPIDEERDYYSRLEQLAIGRFDRDRLIRVGNILRRRLKSLSFAIEAPDYYGPEAKRSEKYDFVFIDSRTGVTEVGGLCIGPLSDQLIVFCSLNDQNLEGTRGFLEEIGILAPRTISKAVEIVNDEQHAIRLDPKPTMIVASPVPIGEIEFKRERLKQLDSAIGRVDSVLTYHPRMSLMESIFTRDFREEYLSNEYEKLSNAILNRSEDEDFTTRLVNRCGLSQELSDEFRKYLGRFPLDSIRLHSKESEDGQIFDILVHFLCHSKNLIKHDVDFIRYDSLLRKIVTRTPPGVQFITNESFDAILERAEMLSRWSLITADSDLRIARYNSALKLIEPILDEILPSKRWSQALGVRASIYVDHQEYDKAISDCSKNIGLENITREQKSIAFRTSGLAKFRTGRITEAISDYRESIIHDNYNNKACGLLAIALLIMGSSSQSEAVFERFFLYAEKDEVEELKLELDDVAKRYPEFEKQIKAILVKIDHWKPSNNRPLIR